jgi:hypothetical protein
VLHVNAHPGTEGGFVEGSGSEVEDGLRGLFFGGRKAVCVDFEEQDTDDKAGALIPVDKGVVANYADRVGSRQVDEVRITPVGIELLRLGKGGLKKAGIAHSRSAAVEGKKAIMKREGVSLIDPDRFIHLASAFSVLR